MVDSVHLVSDLYGVVARKDHEVFRLREMRIEEIGAWNYFGVLLGADMDARLSQVNVSSRIVVNGSSSMVALLEQGAGISVLPALAAQRMLTSKLGFRAFKDPGL